MFFWGSMRDFIENKALYNSIYDPTHHTHTLEKTIKTCCEDKQANLLQIKSSKASIYIALH